MNALLYNSIGGKDVDSCGGSVCDSLVAISSAAIIQLLRRGTIHGALVSDVL